MSYLILDAQLNLLRRNLEEVERVVDAFEEGRRGLQELMETPPQRARDTLSDVLASLGQLRDAYDEGEDEDEIFRHIDDITRQVRDVRTALRRSMDDADTLARRSPARLGDFRTTLNMELVDKLTEAKIKKLKELQAEVRQAMALEDTQPAAALKKAHAAWESFANEVVPGTREVFGEYVEFLGGLALRYTGFDRGMCVIADELMTSTGRLPGFIWRSLTLPSRDERLSLTHMIGIGFPEWTIWSLPLSVHAIGVAWMQQTEAVRAWAAAHTSDEDAALRMEICVADAVATHVLGPAYGCALILLRLNPFEAFEEEGRLAPKRARAVLTTLEELNKHEPGKGFADDMIQELRDSWHGALRQAGQGEHLEGRESADGLSDEELEEIQEWIAYVATQLGRSSALRGKRWASPVLELSAALSKGEAERIELDLAEEEPADLLRDVLNAAWHCRLLGNEDNRGLETIDDDAKELWRRLEATASGERPRGRRTRGRNRPSPNGRG